MRSAVEHIAREDRQKNGIRHADEAYTHQQQQDGSDWRKPSHVGEALLQFVPHILQNMRPAAWYRPHQEERGDDCKVTEAVDQETVTLACDADDDTCNRWPDQPGAVYHG